MATDIKGDTWSNEYEYFEIPSLSAYEHNIYVYQEERSMTTVLRYSVPLITIKDTRVDEQQVTSEIALMITAPAPSSLFTQCDHFLSHVPRFKNAPKLEKRNNCIEGDIYIMEGMCETLIMFKTLLAGTKLNLCQNKTTD